MKGRGYVAGLVAMTVPSSAAQKMSVGSGRPTPTESGRTSMKAGRERQLAVFLGRQAASNPVLLASVLEGRKTGLGASFSLLETT